MVNNIVLLLLLSVTVITPSRVDDVHAICYDEGVVCFGTSKGTSDDTNECVYDQNCQVLVAHELSGTGRHIFYLITPEKHDYVAVAFSTDQKMGCEGALTCQRVDPVNRPNQVEMKKYKLLEYKIQPLNDTTGVTVVSHDISDGYIKCSITVDDVVHYDDVTVSLAGDQEYYVFVSYGSVNASSIIQPAEGYFIAHGTHFKNNKHDNNNFYRWCQNRRTVCIGGYYGSARKPDTSSGCIQKQDCQFWAVYERPDGDNNQRFRLFSEYPNEYIAVAFSGNKIMGDDSVIQCIPSAPPGQRLQRAYIEKYPKNDQITVDGVDQHGVTLVNITTHTPGIYCEFIVHDISELTRHIGLDDDGGYYILLATGDVGRDEQGQVKGVKYHKGATLSASKFYFSSSTVPVAGSVISYIVLTIVVSIFK